MVNIMIWTVAVMEKQISTFGIETKDGVVSRIGRSYVMTPAVKWNGKGIKWFPDKYKEKTNKEGVDHV